MSKVPKKLPTSIEVYGKMKKRDLTKINGHSFVPISVSLIFFSKTSINLFFFPQEMSASKPIVVLPGNWCLRSDSRRHKCQNSTDASHIR